MSAPGQGSSGSGPPRPPTNGSNIGMPQQRSDSMGAPASGGVAGGAPGSSSQSNLNSIVIEYLSKKGYSKTEAMLRAESAGLESEGRPNAPRSDDRSGAKYTRAFHSMKTWIEENLDIYKPELRRLLWPVFVYSYLNLQTGDSPKEGKDFFNIYKGDFEPEHSDDIRTLGTISLPVHVLQNEVAQTYHSAKYRITVSSVAFHNLIRYLEGKEKEGGDLLIGVIQTFIHIASVERGADDQFPLAQMLNRAKAVENFPAEDEGIPGHNPGSANINRNAGDNVLTKLKLGPMPLDEALIGDVRGDLQEEDEKNPPGRGQSSLVDHFNQRIKREESEDAPTRADIQLPPGLARDVAMEVQKVKEDRDRFKIEGRTGGVGPAVSVCMFTFHNTLGSVISIDFSEDSLMVAVGTTESYIRVWSLDGKPLPTRKEGETPASSRRLIGHSGAVYNVAFSPAIAGCDEYKKAWLYPKFLLSCSFDKTVRLWSLEAWSCVAVYKGHEGCIFDVSWDPFGLYFVTGSLDKTARLWRTDMPAALRLFVGHDKDVEKVDFHPNGLYVFTASGDKTVRMWAVTNGYPVRMFTGHSTYITSMSCSPSGKLLATADDSGTIILWDLASGRLKKRMRGHGKGGVWSLSWSVESTVLVSGGADGTVRIWDVELPDPGKDNAAGAQGRVIAEGGSGQKLTDGNPQGTGAGGKKKGKEVVVTPDQISAFPTKKSPVYKVRFTRMNLVVAGGAFMP